jgi:SAM-dependent methyltransferase
MDIWKFYDITHREHVVCNPTSEEKLARLVGLLRLPGGARVVDIASGKGEFLFRLAEAFDVRGVGVDISSYFVADAEKRREARLSKASITFRRMDGADYRPEEPNSLALASCLGASWIYGGHGGTLDALQGMVEPDGWVVVGEPYWLQEPSPEYLEASGLTADAIGTHVSNAAAGEERGLELVHTLVSNRDEWDTYEGLQWYAVSEYARSHPDDPDLSELREKVQRARDAYLRWGRDTVGWAIYLFRGRRP